MSLAPVAEQEGTDDATRLDEGPLVDGLPVLPPLELERAHAVARVGDVAAEGPEV